MKPSPGRVALGYLMLAGLVWALAQWPWHSIVTNVVHAVPMVLLGIVVVPVVATLFVLTVVSITSRPR